MTLPEYQAWRDTPARHELIAPVDAFYAGWRQALAWRGLGGDPITVLAPEVKPAPASLGVAPGVSELRAELAQVKAARDAALQSLKLFASKKAEMVAEIGDLERELHELKQAVGLHGDVQASIPQLTRRAFRGASDWAYLKNFPRCSTPFITS